jgi:hypothetical protein
MSKHYSEQERKKLRDEYNKSRERDLADYFAMIGQGFDSSLNLLSKLIGTAHEPSIGRYKERLLLKLISDFLPKRYSVGSGFVMFPDTEIDSSGNSHTVSKELDIIIYDSLDYSTLFIDQDFVIVKPESVRAIIEVKGRLNSKAIDDSMNKFIDFHEKWSKATLLYNLLRLPNLKCPGLFMMNWDIGISSNGYPECDEKRLVQRIVANYKEKLKGSKNTETLPLLTAAFIHNNCIVNFLKNYPVEGDRIEFGYSLSPGKFSKSEKDRTIAYLLYWLDWYLAVPSNTLITRPDCTEGMVSNEILMFEKWYEIDF